MFTHDDITQNSSWRKISLWAGPMGHMREASWLLLSYWLITRASAVWDYTRGLRFVLCEPAAAAADCMVRLFLPPAQKVEQMMKRPRTVAAIPGARAVTHPYALSCYSVSPWNARVLRHKWTTASGKRLQATYNQISHSGYHSLTFSTWPFAQAVGYQAPRQLWTSRAAQRKATHHTHILKVNTL